MSSSQNTISDGTISSVLQEKREFPPPKNFSAGAHISSVEQLEEIYRIANKNPVKFWEDRARELNWFELWHTAMQWNYPYVKWFAGGKLNASYNCLDRHLNTSRRNKTALIWEAESGETRTLTYVQMHQQVCRLAHGLQRLGVKKGDVVAIYMGMVPEAVIAMLACARIGATHNVVFGGFSSEALRERINDSQAVCLITQDGARRRGDIVHLKRAADEALQHTPTIKNVIVFNRIEEEELSLQDGRDILWSDVIKDAPDDFVPIRLESEHPLFILYTSGSTGKPKGILHTTAGYLTQVAYTTKIIFDLHDSDIYFCSADIGWVTGHSYVVYGPLANGATIFLYEGAPTYPDFGRFWDMIERHKITIFYTAPTAIRSFMRAGNEFPDRYDLSSLRLLGTVGEPINPEAWMWYHKTIGKGKCPIVDTWWQTETGAIMISPLPGVTTTTPGTATKPLPGIFADVVRKDGTPCNPNEGGFLVIKHPWPSMLRTIWGNDERYKNAYWSEFPPDGIHNGFYFAGDGARKDEKGNFWIMGRVDDVVNVSGHRLGTAEIESALVAHSSVAEAAIVTRPDDIKGNALVAFVTVKSSVENSSEHLEKLKEELRNWVAHEIGHLAKPDEIRFTDGLPKTRSGKIMRRLLRELVSQGTVTGDTTTLEDFSVLEKLRQSDEE